MREFLRRPVADDKVWQAEAQQQMKCCNVLDHVSLDISDLNVAFAWRFKSVSLTAAKVVQGGRTTCAGFANEEYQREHVPYLLYSFWQ